MDEKDAGPAYPCRYQLRIVMDEDGILDYVHFHGVMEYTLTFHELPKPLRQKLRPIVKYFMRLKVERASLTQREDRPLRTDSENHDLTDAPAHTIETLFLLAWYLDWAWRRQMARSREATWHCLECACEVTHDREHCTNASCQSWNRLYKATGIQRLHLVPEAQSA